MKISKRTLRNGLRVVTIPMKDNPTASVLVLVEAGSKYEKKSQNGISHFLEHMCFKGTEKRPQALDILRELDSMGSAYNAFTSHEYTGYYAKADAEHLPKIFEIISDIYLHSILPEAEIEKEKGVIIEEINMYKDMPHKHVQDLFTRLLYGDQPAGWDITGEKENVLSMKREDFIAYKDAHYLPQATVIAVAGSINEEDVVGQAEELFKDAKTGEKEGKQKVTEHQEKPEILISFKETDQAHFVLGVRTYDLFDKRDPVLSVLSSIFSGGMSSRLFQRIREEMGVGYYLNASNDTFTDHGFFQISAGVDKGRIREVIEAVLDECNKVKRGEVSEGELEKAKECLIGGMKFSLESTDDVANFYGAEELFRREIKTLEEKVKEIRKVSKEDIRETASGIFKDESLNMALIGPFRDKEEFSKILKF